MENKEYNTVEDFVFNKSFQEWVLSNDPYSTKFWLNWVSYNPDKATLVNYSRAIVDSLPANKRKAPEDEINDQIEKIISNTNDRPVVLSSDLITPGPKARVLIISRKNWLSIVAIFILVVASTWYLARASNLRPDPYKSFASGNAASFHELANNSDTVQRVSLPDGSAVLLEGKSKLSYTGSILPDKREVFLAGKASFNIKKDLSRPFYVYTQGAIIKATGTSFEVDMFPDKKITVTVSRGNVLVSKRKDLGEISIKPSQAGTIVTPNQQLVYNELNNVLYKTLVKNPAGINKIPPVFVFVNKPVTEIFDLLQNYYRIPILYDKESISSCLLSVNVSNLSYFDQLNAICTAMHASYDAVDGTILIAAAGCK